MSNMRRVNYTMALFAWCIGIIAAAGAAQSDPFALPGSLPGLDQPPQTTSFSISGTLIEADGETRRFEIAVTVPADHYLYAEQFSITMKDHELKVLSAPEAKRKKDPISGEVVEVYDEDFRVTCQAAAGSADTFDVTVTYQGCNDKLCFMPQTEVVTLGKTDSAQEKPGASGSAEPAQKAGEEEPEEKTGDEKAAEKDWKQRAEGFERGGNISGSLASEAFRDFLEKARQGKAAPQNNLQKIIEENGWIVACLLILLGGLALNLTPCVLPMIPINIAIIGAGAQAGSRGRGLLLGSFYGAGMAAVYGVLGVVVVLTGATFGDVNASPWFNAVITLFFVALALAMFDIIHIDFSRFQAKTNVAQKKKGSLPAAFILGGIIALLAGACVAPVVISVILFATELYAGGTAYGLLLPFLLGIGMALPWPFAGAGLSFLPRPGKWMGYVKYAFGVIILAIAVYYGYMAYHLFRGQGEDVSEQIAQVQEEHLKEGWFSSLPAALAEAQKQQKPVFIDFWATWCKNCLQMERTTFKDEKVLEALKPFVKLKYQAEDPDKPETKEVLDHFGVIGLPTYVVLLPKNEQKGLPGG